MEAFLGDQKIPIFSPFMEHKKHIRPYLTHFWDKEKITHKKDEFGENPLISQSLEW